MKIVITVTRTDSHGRIRGLTRACQRRNINYSLFFTADGVSTLGDSQVIECAAHADEAIACEFSWDQQGTKDQCPVEIGSQTDHSRLLKTADRLVTL